MSDAKIETHKRVTGLSGNEIFCLSKLGLRAGQLCVGNSVVAIGFTGGFGASLSTLGGRVAVYDGLVQEAESPEELAGVLAHEIEHVRRRHIIEALVARLLTMGALQHAFGGGASQAHRLLDLSFGRAQELEADRGGLERLRRARVGTEGYERFFVRRAGDSLYPALLSGHPASADRAELVRTYRGGPADPVLTGAEWESLKSICR